MQRSLSSRFRAVALLLLVASCVSNGKSTGQKRIEALSRASGEFVDELQRERAELVDVLVAHNAMVGMQSGDLVAQYAQFNKRLRSAEARRPALDRRLSDVRSSADAYFTLWEADLPHISDEGLRRTSADRLRHTRDAYDEYRRKSEQARDSLDPLLKSLRDHATFLGVDLNPQSLSVVGKDTRALQTDAKHLYGVIEDTMAAGQEFNRALAMRLPGVSPR